MRKPDLAAMPLEELWRLHEEITRVLPHKIVAERRNLEDRLAKLNRVEIFKEPRSRYRRLMAGRTQRRKYPQVLPKYFNPQVPSETWSGRGKRPRWLVAALETGHRLDEFEIAKVDEGAHST